jgi:integrase
MKGYYRGNLFSDTRTHTDGHQLCPACAEARLVDARTLTAEMFFGDAFDLWLSHRLVATSFQGALSADVCYLKPKTIKDYRLCENALKKFFGRLTLGEIHVGHLREYQRARAYCDKEACRGGVGAWARPCGANRIRKEITLLLRILRAARLWGDEEKDFFRPLRRVENDVQRSMEPEEQRRFLAIAASREEWQFIHWYSVLALQTTASTNELRALRLADVMLSQGILQIRREGAKNKYRIRSIPLETPEVVWALGQLIERARLLGATSPHHYLFPIQETKGHYDPTRPMSDSGLKKRWNAVRAAAGLDWLRPYDLRHTAITRMAEAGVPIQVIMAFAGHMTLRMQQHYTAISMMSRRKWAQSVWGENSRKPPQKEQYGTSFPQIIMSGTSFSN